MGMLEKIDQTCTKAYRNTQAIGNLIKNGTTNEPLQKAINILLKEVEEEVDKGNNGR